VRAAVIIITKNYKKFNLLLELRFVILIGEFLYQIRPNHFEEVFTPIRELTVSGSDAVKVADALNSTTYRILQLVSKEPLDVSTIAEKLDISEAYVSEQIRGLEDLKLIQISYGRGKRGIRKISKLAFDRVTIVIKT
jgi:hypothetical protein